MQRLAQVTNLLYPDQAPTRNMLLATAAYNVVLAAGVIDGYSDRGL